MARAEIPIACTLPSAALAERLTWIRRVTSESLLSHRQEGATLHLVYRPEAAQELRRIVEGERECCAFLKFDLREGGRNIELSICAPEDAGVEARWLFEQFLPQAATGTRSFAPGCCN